MTERADHRARGFTLIEVIVSMSLMVLIFSGLVTTILALQRASQPRTVGTTGIRMAPSLGELRNAALLHEFFSRRVNESKAVYVFGGYHGQSDVGIPATAVVRNQRPLALMGMPPIAGFGAGLPPSSPRFFELYEAALGAQMETATPRDFTVLVVGPWPAPTGDLRVTAFVQVRWGTQAVDGEPHSTYWVRLWSPGDYMEYRFGEPESYERWLPLNVGATRSWYRYSEANRIMVEGPAMLVFPDPYRPSGRLGLETESPNVSRFLYWVGGE